MSTQLKQEDLYNTSNAAITQPHENLKTNAATENIQKKVPADPDQPLGNRTTETFPSGAEKQAGASATRTASTAEVEGQKVKDDVHGPESAIEDKQRLMEAKVEAEKADELYKLHKKQANAPGAPLAEKITARLQMVADTVASDFAHARKDYYEDKTTDAHHELGEGALTKEKVAETVERVELQPEYTTLEAIKQAAEDKANGIARSNSDKPKPSAWLTADADERKIQEAEAAAKAEEQAANAAENPGVIVNSLEFLGEKMTETAQYLKGDETTTPSSTGPASQEVGILQSIKDGASKTLEIVGEKTKQTAEYLKGDPSVVRHDALADSAPKTTSAIPETSAAARKTSIGDSSVRDATVRDQSLEMKKPVTSDPSTHDAAVRDVVSNYDKNNEVSSHVKGKVADKKHEIHKDQAKDDTRDAGERVNAGMKALGDKAEGAKHNVDEMFFDRK